MIAWLTTNSPPNRTRSCQSTNPRIFREAIFLLKSKKPAAARANTSRGHAFIRKAAMRKEITKMPLVASHRSGSGASIFTGTVLLRHFARKRSQITHQMEHNPDKTGKEASKR